MSWLWVAIGGALGSTARYGVGRLWPATPGGFPIPTITVNLLGSFAIGLLYIWIVTRAGGADSARLFWMTGVLGGFTTYSAFALESALLGFSMIGVTYIAATVIGCMLAAVAGLKMGTFLVS